MSFDLAVWHAERSLDDRTAHRIYQAICEGDELPVDGSLTANLRIDDFMRALGGLYPNLDAVPEEAVDDSPWASGFAASDSHSLFNIRWSSASTMLAEMITLAAQYGLVLYDPQEGRVHNPPHLSARPTWMFWRRKP